MKMMTKPVMFAENKTEIEVTTCTEEIGENDEHQIQVIMIIQDQKEMW